MCPVPVELMLGHDLLIVPADRSQVLQAQLQNTVRRVLFAILEIIGAWYPVIPDTIKALPVFKKIATNNVYWSVHHRISMKGWPLVIEVSWFPFNRFVIVCVEAVVVFKFSSPPGEGYHTSSLAWNAWDLLFDLAAKGILFILLHERVLIFFDFNLK